MKMQPPQLLADVYRDLRDRRLLLPAAALLVALVAVPVLLSSSPSTPPAPTAVAEVETTAAAPAVFAEQVGIRNYRQRLRALKKKNPFNQKFAAPEPGSVESDSSLSAAAGLSESPDPGGPPGVTGATAATAPEPSGDGSSRDGGGSTDTTTKAKDEQSVPITKLISRRIDVKVGPVGAAKKIKNVRALDFLPSGKVPVTAFLGVNESGKRAAFLVSADTVSTEGDGRCVPAPPAQCQFLVLRVGEQRRLHYQPEGAEEPTVYRLELLGIRDKVVKSFDG